VLIEVDDGHVRSLLGEHDGDAAADAAVPAGYQGGLARELAGWLIASGLRLGSWVHQVFAAGLFLLGLRWASCGLLFWHFVGPLLKVSGSRLVVPATTGFAADVAVWSPFMTPT
jgi:hypothetical protein